MKPSVLTLPSLETPTLLRGMAGPISVTPEVSEVIAANAPVATDAREDAKCLPE